MRTFSSILPFTHRFGLRRATCITNDAQGGGGEKNQKDLVEFGLSGRSSTLGEMLRGEEKQQLIASDLAIHRLAWVLLAEEHPLENGQILINLRQVIAAVDHDPTDHDCSAWLGLFHATEIWGMRVVARHMFKPPYPTDDTMEYRIEAFRRFHKRLDTIVADNVLRGIIEYAADKFGNEHSPRIKIMPLKKSASQLDVMRNFDLETRPATLDQS